MGDWAGQADRDRLVRVAGAFLRLTDEADEPSRALRLLTLHMLAGHAPVVFRQLGLDAPFRRALADSDRFPTRVHPGLFPGDAMARLDVALVRRLHGLPGDPPDPADTTALVEGVRRLGWPLLAWLLAELARAVGVDLPRPAAPIACRRTAPVAYLYYLTHVVLLQTGYLHHRRPRGGLSRTQLTRLGRWVPEVAAAGRVDLAAEVAFSLQAAGCPDEAAAPALALICRQVTDVGCVPDPSVPPERTDLPHSTAAALVALAGAAGPVR